MRKGLADREIGTMNDWGAITNVKCKANRKGRIDRKVCRNNCAEWDRQARKCRFNYG